MDKESLRTGVKTGEEKPDLYDEIELHTKLQRLDQALKGE